MSSGFVPSDVSRAQAHIWLAAGAGVCTRGTSGAVFCPSLSSAQMKCRIKSSLVDAGGAFIVTRAGIVYGSNGGKLVEVVVVVEGWRGVWNVLDGECSKFGTGVIVHW